MEKNDVLRLTGSGRSGSEKTIILDTSGTGEQKKLQAGAISPATSLLPQYQILIPSVIPIPPPPPNFLLTSHAEPVR
jgi:hypothetical protein